MANGIMQGTGTEIDPYLVEDVYDFIAIGDTTAYPTPDDYYIYFKLTTDLNFNDHNEYMYGFDSGTSIINRNSSSNGYAILNGDSHNIYNLIFRNYGMDGAFVFNEIRNTNFVNTVMTTCYHSGSPNSSVIHADFYNCNLGIFVSGTCSQSIFRSNFTDCSISIKGNVTDLEFGSQTLTRCMVHLNVKNVSISQYIINGYNSKYYAKFDNCRITGNVSMVNEYNASISTRYMMLYITLKKHINCCQF